MLRVNVGEASAWDSEQQRFVTIDGFPLDLEHSLVSLSKWESKWEVPFLGSTEQTDEQIIDYVKCMTLNPNVPPEVYGQLTPENVSTITDYIGKKMTATWIKERNAPGSRSAQKEIITAEVIYYWLVALQIDFQVQDWHLNRLLMLVRVCNEKNSTEKPKKMSKAELAQRNRDLNAQRRAQMNSRG